MNTTLVRRYETRGKKWWIELHEDELGFTFTANDGGGNLGCVSRSEALHSMNHMVEINRKDGIIMRQVYPTAKTEN